MCHRCACLHARLLLALPSIANFYSGVEGERNLSSYRGGGTSARPAFEETPSSVTQRQLCKAHSRSVTSGCPKDTRLLQRLQLWLFPLAAFELILRQRGPAPSPGSAGGSRQCQGLQPAKRHRGRCGKAFGRVQQHPLLCKRLCFAFAGHSPGAAGVPKGEQLLGKTLPT